MVRLNKNEIIKNLKEFKQKFGRSPTGKMWNEKGFSPHSRTVGRKFGSWSKALKKAGLDLNQSIPQSSKTCSCSQCDSEFQRQVSQIKKSEDLFCSQSCAATYNNSHGKTGRSNSSKKGLGEAPTSQYSLVNSGFVLTPNFCLGCGDQIMTRERAKYCSIQCQQIYEKLLKKSETITRSQDANCRQLKKVVIDDRGRKCETCGRSSWNEEDIPLDMDHIDGNHKNNSLDNLRLLCPNCHAQTPTYKARNTGNGRHYRRKRYAEGKSY